jgi:hypothetical protein
MFYCYALVFFNKRTAVQFKGPNIYRFGCNTYHIVIMRKCQVFAKRVPLFIQKIDSDAYYFATVAI